MLQSYASVTLLSNVNIPRLDYENYEPVWQFQFFTSHLQSPASPQIMNDWGLGAALAMVYIY